MVVPVTMSQTNKEPNQPKTRNMQDGDLSTTGLHPREHPPGSHPPPSQDEAPVSSASTKDEAGLDMARWPF